MTQALISWTTVERVASRVAGVDAFASSYLADSITSDFRTATERAVDMVGADTDLVTPPEVRFEVLHRPQWVGVNLQTLDQLTQPLAAQIASRRTSRLAVEAGSVQLGVALGWMSKRVLGQYVFSLASSEPPAHSDNVYYVAPNILALEKRYGFPPQEFRMWIALHECTHRAQFTGVPWLADHFRSSIASLVAELEPETMRDSLKRLTSSVRDRGEASDSGLLRLLPPEQAAKLESLSSLMAILEGHGEVVMGRAAEQEVPNADRFHRVLHARRQDVRGVSKVFQRLLGLDSKLAQYRVGENFIRHIEEYEPGLMKVLWSDAVAIPNKKELSDPQIWIERVRREDV